MTLHLRRCLCASLASAALAVGLDVPAQYPGVPGTLNADQRELRAIYQELVEINTTDSVAD